MTLQRTWAVALRHFYLIRGSFSRVVPLFAWVAIDIVLWGYTARYLNAASAAPINFVPSLLGAIFFWDFFHRVMQGVTLAFFEDVWSRNFLNIFATPISVTEYVGGMVISSVITSAAGLLVMWVLASAVFGLTFAVYGAAALGFGLVLFLFGIAMGIVGCAIVLRWGPAAEWFIWPLPALLSPFVGVLYPLSTLPPWMQAVAIFLPPSYVFEGLRALVAGQPVPTDQLLWGTILSALFVVLARDIFARVHRHALRSGLVARYSAESAS